MKIELTKRAVKDLDRLQRSQPDLFDKVTAKVGSLSSFPETGKPLVGPLKGRWSLRVGSLRIVYEKTRDVITVLTVNDRKEVYR